MPCYIRRPHCNNSDKRYEVTENSSLLLSDTALVVLSVSNERSASHVQSSSKDLLTNEHEGMMLPQNARKHSLSDAASNQIWTLSYLLTPWSRVLLEKLKVNSAASQEISRIYGTRKFLTVPTSARHLSLSSKLQCCKNLKPHNKVTAWDVKFSEQWVVRLGPSGL
jgi:hypothetical protein